MPEVLYSMRKSSNQPYKQSYRNLLKNGVFFIGKWCSKWCINHREKVM